MIGEKVFRYNLDSIDQLKLKDDKKINDQFSNRKSTDSIQINNSIEKNIKSILNINKNIFEHLDDNIDFPKSKNFSIVY